VIAALGGGSDFRDASVVVRIRLGDVALPEQVLLTYHFNDAKNSVATSFVRGYTSPLKRLAANEKITVQVFLQDSTKASYDVGAVAASLTELVPSTSVVSEAMQPAIRSIYNFASRVTNVMNSQSTAISATEELSPYGDFIKHLAITLHGKNGQNLGTVRVTLQSTVSLLTTPQVSLNYIDQASRESVESPTKLTTTIAGVTVQFANVIKAIPSYSEMVAARTFQSMAKFCGAAVSELQDFHGLTRHDSGYVLNSVILDAAQASEHGFPGVRDWPAVCVADHHVPRLAAFNGYPPPPTRVDSDRLNALGCWMTDNSEGKCSYGKGVREKMVQRLLDDRVVLDVDPTFTHLMPVPPDNVVPRETLLAKLKGSAKEYGCVDSGIKVRTHTGKTYRIDGPHPYDRLETVKIYEVADSMASCPQ